MIFNILILGLYNGLKQIKLSEYFIFKEVYLNLIRTFIMEYNRLFKRLILCPTIGMLFEPYNFVRK